MNGASIAVGPGDMKTQCQSSSMKICLAGNPNSGKTSLFNRLTGTNQKVGNWSGVTVELKKGNVRHNGVGATVIDLPGTYSLSTSSPDEKVARDFLMNEKPDVVINVIDATNIDRQLYLTIQLLELGVRPVLALNMWDEVKGRKMSIDIALLGRLLGLTIIPTNARTGDGIDNLLSSALDRKSGKEKKTVPFSLPLPGELEAAIVKLKSALDSLPKLSYPSRWIAVQLLEKDKVLENDIAEMFGGKSVLAVRDRLVTELNRILGDDPQTRIAEERYGFISGAVKECVRYPVENRLEISDRIDSVLTHRVWAYPIFLVFMWLLFQATFKLGEHPMGWIETLFGWLGTVASATLPEGVFRDLLVDGIIAGVGGVIGFLPNILILFLGISIMEDTGYMARAAFITDRLMHRIGLHGKSFIPMLMGMGCSVPAIMAARTLESPKDRIKTILLTPLISCSARLPVFVLFAGALFPRNAGNVVFLFQVILSFAAFVVMALLFKHTLFRNAEDHAFVMELPPYRLPTGRSVLIHMWHKTEHYLKKMGSVVLVFSIILWWAGIYPKAPGTEQRFDSRIEQVRSDMSMKESERKSMIEDLETKKHAEIMEQTYIGRIGKTLEPVVRPFGTDWRGAVSLVTGFVAKEIVVGSMGVLYAVGGEEDEQSEGLRAKIREHFTPLSSFAFMLFVLLYTPCLVALVTVIRELKSWKWSLFSLGYQLIFAWWAATAVFQIGTMLGIR
ncbi:MAG: ferrous iron transport protein B [Chitinispirillaceae bacterium]